MGNHISCMSPAASTSYKQNLITILHSDSRNATELEAPITAAEVMMEFPAQFLCCISNAVLSGCRICAVPADEELRTSELYMLLPMHKLNTRFPAEDITFLDALASLHSKKNSMANYTMAKGTVSQTKVASFPPSTLSASPLSASKLSANRSSTSEDFRAHLSMGSQSFKQLSMNVQEPSHFMRGGCNKRMCRSKSWIPKLETITEAHAIL